MSKYEIDQDGALLIYNDSDEPIIYQPQWPNGAEWSDGEAEAWADQYILSLTDETADLPGDGPEQPTKPRPVIEAEVAASDSE